MRPSERTGDVWGEALIAQGGATYDRIKDLLRPLFYSTGNVYTELGVHNLLFGEDGGTPPYIIPLADGSRIARECAPEPGFPGLGGWARERALWRRSGPAGRAVPGGSLLARAPDNLHG
jgi:hypothetical protein